MALDDMILFDFAIKEWVAVLQMGFRPEERWGSALAYNDTTEQLYIFGGGQEKGTCGTTTWCCELNSIKVKEMISEYNHGIHEL
jgi:hypothetical protein